MPIIARARRPLAGLTTFALLTFANGAIAQTFDVRKLIQGVVMGATCEKYKRWLGNVPVTSQGRGGVDAVALADDAVFTPAFGKSYRDVTAHDMSAAQREIAECQRNLGWSYAELSAARMVWSESTHRQLVAQLEARHAARQELASRLAELAALSPSEADYVRLDDLVARGTDVLRRTRQDAAIPEFLAKANEARLRIGIPVLQGLIDRAAGGSDARVALLDLASVRRRIADSRLPADAVKRLADDWTSRVRSIGQRFVDQERARLAEIDPKRDLVRHTAQVMELRQQFASVADVVPELGGLLSENINRRSTAVATAIGQVHAAILSASSQHAVESALAGRFLPEELNSGAGRELREAASARIAALQRTANDVAVFGVQPEHARAGLAKADSRALTATRQELPILDAGQVHLCDTLSGHPQDPERVGSGVTDTAMKPAEAVSACRDAVKAAPNNRRFRFQLGRALLEAGNPSESVVHLKQAASLGSAAAHYYLAAAYAAGAPGAGQNKTVSEQHLAKANALGWGRAAPASPGSSRIQDVTFKEEEYEDAKLIRAIYYGDSEGVKRGTFYTMGYIMGQARALAAGCKSFKLTELETFNSAIERQHNRSATQMVSDPVAAFATVIAMGTQVARNVDKASELNSASRRVDNAPAYGDKDIAQFAAQHGGCQSPPMKRYVANLRSLMARASTQ